MELYRAIVPAAVRMTWRQRRLWPLALAMTWASTVGEPELLRRSLDLSDPGLVVTLVRDVARTGLLTAGGLAQALVTVRENPAALAKLVVVLGVFAVLALGLTWLSVVAQGALVSGVAFAHAGRPVPVGRCLRAGRRKFWPVLLLNIAVKVVVALLLLGLWGLRHLSAVAFTPLFVLAGLAILLLYTWLKIVVATVVLQDLPLRQGMARTWQLLQRRGWDCVVLLSLLILLTSLVAVALLVAVLLAMMPFLLVTGIARLLDFTAGAQLYFILSWLTVAGLALFAAVLVTSLQWSAWALVVIREATGHHPK